jgi:hypothetical protein
MLLQNQQDRRLAGEEGRENLLGELAGALFQQVRRRVGPLLGQPRDDGFDAGHVFADDVVAVVAVSVARQLDVVGEPVGDLARQDQVHLARDEVVDPPRENR